jgi:glycosyltransferase involved in cell wall biosynthesis
MTEPRQKIAYIVSRFPAASETFVVRELNALVADHEVEVTLMSLFASNDGFLHEEAKPLLAGLRRPRPAEAAIASGYWLVRRPLRLLGLVARVLAGTWRHPRTLARSLATLPLAAAHARTVRDERIGHVHAHFASYPALAAWLCGRLVGVPYSFTAHAYDIFVSQDLLAEKVAGAEFVVTISEFNRRFLRDFGGDRMTPVEVVHAGVDPRRYTFRERTIPGRGPVAALCVATLQEKKGHAVLLEALASAPELERLNVELVGGGELRGPLEAQVAALGLGERVRFLGAREEAEVRTMLDRADLFVLPSLIAADGQMEGLPVVLIEALACGLPSVATRLSGIPELISDRETGVLAEPGDAASLAAALTWVVDGCELDLAAGRRLVELEFDVRKSAARMAELLCAGPRDRR